MTLKVCNMLFADLCTSH